MIQPLPVAVTLAVLVAVIVLMAVSWRRRHGRQHDLLVPAPPAATGEPGLVVDGLYLATTFAGRPLDRVVAGGLGFRAAARLSVSPQGLGIERAGAAPVFLPAAALTGAGVATWTIDRTVERNGLTVVGWRLPRADGGTEQVESSFRIELAPRAELIAAVARLVGDVPSEEEPRAEQ